MTTTRPTGTIIDTRDLIRWREHCMIDVNTFEEIENEDDRADVEAINAIEDAGIPDFPYGEIMIREDYFTDYAQELAEHIGAIDANSSWPLSYIDWDAAAEALKQDYKDVEWDGSPYLVRAA